ncbi:uncharacterized protein [Palaemon carinicauda]|uniref:uncharacterized protein n=1 Tax=Palaemon carinicauda TaxID=392227 RepID=UPI0035B586A3
MFHYQHQTESGQYLFGSDCATLHTEESSFLLPLQNDPPLTPSGLQQPNALSSDLNSFCSNLSFQDIMEATGFDSDSNSLDSLIQSLWPDASETDESCCSAPSPAENSCEAATPNSSTGYAYAQDVILAMDSQQELQCHTTTTYSDMYNHTDDFSPSANLSMGNLTNNLSVRPTTILPLQCTGNVDTKIPMPEMPANIYNGYSVPDVTVFIDPWAANDNYSSGYGHYNVFNSLDLGDRDHNCKNMTSPQDSSPENPHRRPGQHRNCRVFLPEGEDKIKHIRQLANTRAKEHNARKKNERLTAAANLQTEEKRKQLLQQKYLQLLQEYRKGLSVKAQIQRDCSQCNFLSGQSNTDFSQ